MKNELIEKNNNEEQYENHKGKLDVIFHEYNKLRDEMMHYINVKLQIPIWSFSSASIAISIVFFLTGKVSPGTIACLLYIITIVFVGMTMNYVTALFSIHRISSYIKTNIEPKVNEIIGSAKHPLLQWESFVQKKRKNFLSLLLEVIGEIGTSLLLLFPGLASLIAAYMVEHHLKSQQTQVELFKINSLCLNLLSKLALGVYIFSIISLIIIMFYAIKIGIVTNHANANTKKQ